MNAYAPKPPFYSRSLYIYVLGVSFWWRWRWQCSYSCSYSYKNEWTNERMLSWMLATSPWIESNRMDWIRVAWLHAHGQAGNRGNTREEEAHDNQRFYSCMLQERTKNHHSEGVAIACISMGLSITSKAISLSSPSTTHIGGMWGWMVEAWNTQSIIFKKQFASRAPLIFVVVESSTEWSHQFWWQRRWWRKERKRTKHWTKKQQSFTVYI